MNRAAFIKRIIGALAAVGIGARAARKPISQEQKLAMRMLEDHSSGIKIYDRYMGPLKPGEIRIWRNRNLSTLTVELHGYAVGLEGEILYSSRYGIALENEQRAAAVITEDLKRVMP